jgi:hypothetical protein
LIKQADPAFVEEVKWKKPSRPEGVPVWSHEGILCVCDTLKNAVRLTFPKGAQMKDPHKLFHTRLESKTVRAIDFHEGDPINEAALQALLREAVGLNTSQAKEPSFMMTFSIASRAPTAQTGLSACPCGEYSHTNSKVGALPL